MPFGAENIEWCGYPKGKNFDDMFICFDTTHERNRHRQTDTT